MRIEQLQVGERFRLAALPHKEGQLLSLSEGAALVRYGGKRHVAFQVKRGDEVVGERAFDAPAGSALTISLHTEVERVEAGDTCHTEGGCCG